MQKKYYRNVSGKELIEIRYFSGFCVTCDIYQLLKFCNSKYYYHSQFCISILFFSS